MYNICVTLLPCSTNKKIIRVQKPNKWHATWALFCPTDPTSSSVDVQLYMTYFLAEDIFWWATCAKNHLYLQCFSGNGSAQSALVLVRGNDISNKNVQWSCSYQKFLAYKCLIVDMQRQGEKLNHCRCRSLIGFGKREKRKGNHGDLFPRPDFKFRASFHADFTNDVSVKVTTLGLKYSQSRGEPTHRWKQRYTELQHLCWKLKKWNACSKRKKKINLWTMKTRPWISMQYGT